jgi:hypothetical protein
MELRDKQLGNLFRAPGTVRRKQLWGGLVVGTRKARNKNIIYGSE